PLEADLYLPFGSIAGLFPVQQPFSRQRPANGETRRGGPSSAPTALPHGNAHAVARLRVGDQGRRDRVEPSIPPPRSASGSPNARRSRPSTAPALILRPLRESPPKPGPILLVSGGQAPGQQRKGRCSGDPCLHALSRPPLVRRCSSRPNTNGWR